jgi:hypothetical protein
VGAHRAESGRRNPGRRGRVVTRYDWPAPPRGRDDPVGRATHLQQFRPSMDPLTIPAPTPPTGRAPHQGLVPHNAPVGYQNLWFPIGPTTMTNGQAGGNPNVVGRIRDLQVEPSAGLRVYAASAGGGVWFSADRGDTWRPLDEWQTSDRAQGNIANALACGAIQVVWGTQPDGSDDVVWVGTGEPALSNDGEWQPTGAQPGGLQLGGSVAGVGFLNRDPAVASGAWTIVKGALPATDADTLRGESFYRIVADPGKLDQLIAATTKGLYLKPSGGGWTRITTYLATVSMQPMDVVMTRLPAGVRIWVASASLVSVAEFAQPPATPIDPTALVFKTVALPGVYLNPPTTGVVGSCLQLATDGSKVYVLGRGVLTGDRTNPPAALWTIDATAAIGGGAASGITATAVKGTPPDLYMSAGDQSGYDMCIAAHPTVPGRIYIGGAAVGTSTGWNGAIYRCETTATDVNPTLIGEGTHSDVHVLRVGPPPPGQPTKRTVWTGTDGGLFRSDSDGDPSTFVNRNDGVAVLQPGFIANHPTNPGIVVAGFQDNGTAVRTGDGVWRQDFRGDGGGVAYDPSSTNRYFRQYTLASWESSDNGAIAPIERRHARTVGNNKTSETIESESSLFYSGCDAVVLGGATHLVLGSDRVWYSRDWGRSWITLPTGTDPRGGDNPDLFQDVLEATGGGLNYVERVGSTDCCSTTYAGRGTKGSGIITVRASVAPNDAAGNLVLRVLALYPSGLVWLVGTRAPAATGSFTWTPLAGVQRQLIKYPVAASADETALQNGQPLSFLPAPSVVSDVYVHDPARGQLGSCYVTTTGWAYHRVGGPTIPLDTLWYFDGTDKWMPTGLSITHPNGTWAVAADRVTAPALGVVVDPDDSTAVFVATSVGVVKGVLTIGGTAAAPTYSWAWAQFMNGLPEAVVQDLSIFKGSGLKLLRAATQSRGVWEVDLANPITQPLSYLRLFHTDTRRVLPTPTGGDLLSGDPTNPVHWDESPDVVIDASGTAFTAPPSEAQLDALPSPGPATDNARVSTTARHVKVHVLAHHRVQDVSIPADQVKIALVRHDLPGSGVVPITALWGALVAAAAGNAAPASLPDGWTTASTQLWQSPTSPIDPRMPRAVTFDVDLSSAATGTAIVFLAVVMSTSNQISNVDLALGGANQAQAGNELVVASPHVAAKSLVLT